MMKYLTVLFALFAFCCESKPNMSDQPFEINIWDFNPSMSYTLHYRITPDSLFVKSESGIEGEDPKVLVKSKISEVDSESIANLLHSLPWDELEESYSNPLVEDGDQKIIKVQIGNRRKEIEALNVHIPELAKLFECVNRLLDPDYEIKYSK